MTKRPSFPESDSYASFHAIAAKRGDGMHPLLLQAFAKSGSVSGPPAPSKKNDENVVQLVIGRKEKVAQKGSFQQL
ncbi:hypothetical protein LP7551_01174 [Roseibium album]|nr:hypothetical protein LP7551_01174 [Roseibium album]